MTLTENKSHSFSLGNSAMKQKPILNSALELPKYDPNTDYQNLYGHMFQQNEAMLRHYDELLEQREADMKLYKAMRRGDYSHMNLPERS